MPTVKHHQKTDWQIVSKIVHQIVIKNCTKVAPMKARLLFLDSMKSQWKHDIYFTATQQKQA